MRPPVARNCSCKAFSLAAFSASKSVERLRSDLWSSFSRSISLSTRSNSRWTEVKVVLKYDPPGGKAGDLVAKFLGEDPEKQIREDLLRLKHFLEAGEVPVVER